jgi:catechol 2,3-dioxygenase-like lactoylglutathione lyase family enzyme
MAVVWQPDPDNAYLSSGPDNLALYRGNRGDPHARPLDHFGFIVASLDDLRAGYEWAQRNQLEIVRPLREHRDGSPSFYIRDPEGNMIQVLHEPNISPFAFSAGRKG